MLFKKKRECKECKKLKEKIANLEYQLLVTNMREEFRKRIETVERETRALQALVKREEES